MSDDDDWRGGYQSRREFGALVAASTAAFSGAVGWSLAQRDQKERDIDVYILRDGEVYEGDLDDIPYDPGDVPDPNTGDVDSWDEAIPQGCALDAVEKDWLVSRLDEDEYPNLDSDDFFEYVGNEVRLERRNTELRMTVDSDYSGEFDAETEYVVEQGYNIEDAC